MKCIYIYFSLFKITFFTPAEKWYPKKRRQLTHVSTFTLFLSLKKVHFFLITQTNQPTSSSVMWYMPGKRAKNIVSCQFTCFVQPAAKKINTSCSLGAAADDDGICCMVHCISATFSQKFQPPSLYQYFYNSILYTYSRQDKTSPISPFSPTHFTSYEDDSKIVKEKVVVLCVLLVELSRIILDSSFYHIYSVNMTQRQKF